MGIARKPQDVAKVPPQFMQEVRQLKARVANMERIARMLLEELEPLVPDARTRLRIRAAIAKLPGGQRT
jgi:hypothetical protein